MNPRDFCKVGRRLASSADPADLRTAAGRVYYAVFNVGAEVIDPIVPVSRGPGGHGQIIRLFQNCIDPDLQTVGDALGGLHSLRIAADYEMGNRRVEEPKTVMLLVKNAEDLINRIDSAFAGANSKPIMKSMQEFWINIERGLLRGRPRIP
jgi:hypothetical protein